MKKLFSIMLLIATALTISGCNSRDRYPEYESGYYKYAVKTEKDGTKKAYLLELTELGKEQTTLIYPEEIDGITVYGMGYKIDWSMWYTDYVGDFGSDNLEKLFFVNSPKEDLMRGEIINLQTTFNVYWNLSASFRRVSTSEGVIYGYNYYKEKIEKPYQYDSPNKIANVSYMYNYDNSENEGYYWVDSYNESVITFIPPMPQRDGYTFEGWYKEEQCLNKWDFESDITGKEIIISDKVHNSYEGLYLYAKWSRNN